MHVLTRLHKKEFDHFTYISQFNVLVKKGTCFSITVSIHCAPEMSEVSKVAKIRNRYNQVPHLTQDTNGIPMKSTVSVESRVLA